MMQNQAWTSINLGIATEILCGYPFESQKYSGELSAIRLLRGDNIGQGRLRWDDAKRWPKHDSDGLNSYKLELGDIVLAMDRPWIEAGLKYAVLDNEDLPCLLVQRVARLRARSGYDQRFIGYVIASSDFTDHVTSIQTGTSVPHISAAQIRSYEFICPPLLEQRAIGLVLSAIDDKLKYNEKLNRNLEAMASALFMSWFVDFDPVVAKAAGRKPFAMNEATAALFPSTFVDSPMGTIPAGWRVEEIRSIVEDVYDGPHATPPEAASGAVFLGIRNFTGTQLDLSDIRYIAEPDWAKWTRRVTPAAHDIVFTYEATLGFFALIPPGLRCCLGRRTALVRPQRQDFMPHFLFHSFVSPDFQEMLMARANTGSTVDRIPLTDFPSYKILWPDAPLRARFEQVAGPLWTRIHHNQAQSTTLRLMRDTLLPKLISGEIRLKDAEKIVGEAT